MPQFSQFISNYIDLILISVLLILILLFIWLFFIWLSLRKFKRLQREMFRGVTKKDLEEVLLYHTKKLEDNSKDIKDIKNAIKRIEADLKISIKKTGVVRFNPFSDTGGDQSFAVALLDSDESGFVISSLYGRSETRIYAKPIKKGKSSFKLSVEEEKAIKKAIKG